MAATVTESTIEVVVEESVKEPGDASPRGSSMQTEADKVRLQQLLRRKMKLARRALGASRSR